MGTSDGWTDLRDDHPMDWNYTLGARRATSSRSARLPLTGKRRQPGRDARARLRRLARRRRVHGRRPSLARRLRARAEPRTRSGWHAYLGGRSRPRERRRPRGALRRLADGAGRARRTRPTAAPASRRRRWPGCGGTIPGYSGPYHLVWSRDLYQVATAQIAAGDRAAAGRALDYLWTRQQQPDGCLPQNSNLDGSPHWPACSSTRSPTRSCSPGSSAAPTPATWSHVQHAARLHPRQAARPRRSAGRTPSGYSPATIAAEIAGARRAPREIAERNGATADARPTTARSPTTGARSVERWTRTTNGPAVAPPYFLRLTVDGNADARHDVHDRRRRSHDRPAHRRRPELPRARAPRRPAAPTTPTSPSTLPVVDRELGVDTPNGQFWHRYNYDGYGETPDGGPFPGPTTAAGCGRSSPASAASTSSPRASCPATSRPAERRRRSGSTRSPPPRTRPRCCPSRSGTTTRRPAPAAASREPARCSATPLGWTHAQFVRLAWSIDAGRPVERPTLVSCRYGGPCSSSAP